jgi:hypothetical protein
MLSSTPPLFCLTRRETIGIGRPQQIWLEKTLSFGSNKDDSLSPVVLRLVTLRYVFPRIFVAVDIAGPDTAQLTGARSGEPLQLNHVRHDGW